MTEKPGTATDRRLEHRKFAREGLSVREIAEKTGASKSTVGRDIEGIAQPDRVTPGGAKVYKLGRFNGDPDYQARVADLSQLMPEGNARRAAAKEFAATGDYRIGDVCRRAFGTDRMIRTPEEKAAAWERLGFDNAA